MCCGASRSPSRIPSVHSARAVQRQSSATMPAASQQSPSNVTFEYTGKTALTVVSPTTGNRYRFDSPGAQLTVDPRDKSMMIYVPNLRPVRFARTP
jgi:hypothetical protein